MKFLKIFLIVVFTSLLANSQSLEIQNINASEWPLIKADVDFKDANGDAFSIQQESDVTVDDGTKLGFNLDQIDCETNIKKFSLLIVLDFSQSMQFPIDHSGPNQTSFYVDYPDRRIDVAIRTIRTMVEEPLIDFSRSELGVISFSDKAVKELSYTQDYNDLNLIDFVNRNVREQELGANTRYNSAFTGWHEPYENSELGNNHGGYPVAGIKYSQDSAQYKPIILFMTDGEPSDIDTKYQLFKNRCIENNITVFGAYFGLTSTPGISDLANATGGKVYSSLSSQEEIREAIEDMIDVVENSDLILPPCELEWTADCSGGIGTLSADIDGSIVSGTFDYSDQIDGNLPELEISDLNPEIVNGASQQFTITAVNNDVILSGYTPTDTDFELQGNLTGTLAAGDSRNITIVYNGSSSTCTETAITINSNACSGNDMNAQAGFMEAIDVNMGQTNVGVPINDLNAVCFTNNTCNSVQVTGLSTSNGTIFPINDFLPRTIQPGDNFNFDFDYNPSGVGSDQADLIIEIDNVALPAATIRGTTSGQAEINTTTSNDDPKTQCDEQETITIEVENFGSVDMDVTNVTLSNNTEFTLTSATSFPVAASTTENITVDFVGTAEGVFTCDVTIDNTSQNEPSRVVTITAERLNSEYTITVSGSNATDVGTICPTELIDITANISEVGSASQALTISEESNDPAIVFNNGTAWQLSDGNDFSFQLDASQIAATGPFTLTVNITDECGDIQDQLTVTGTIEEADAEWDVAIYDNGQVNQYSTDIGVPVTETLQINSTYNRDLSNVTVTKAPGSDPNNYFAIVPSATTIAANGSITVDVTYSPANTSTDALELIVIGEADGTPCLDVSLPQLLFGTGQPSTSSVTDAANYSALIGAEFDVALTFVADPSFNTAVDQVTMRITVEDTKLQLVNASATDQGGGVYEITLDDTNPETLRFLALNPGPSSPANDNSQIVFDFVSTNPANAGVVSGTTADFNLQRASGEVGVPDSEGKPGDNILIQISESNFNGIDANIHQRISGNIRFNATLLIPTDANILATSTLENEGTPDVKRVIPFEIDLTTSSVKDRDKVQADPFILECEILLGNSDQTALELTDLATAGGDTDLIPNNGIFTLDPYCDDDKRVVRLFDSFVTSGNIRIDEPVGTAQNIILSADEDGTHSLKLVNSNGQTEVTFLDQNIKFGQYKFNVPSNELKDGKYFVVLETPTRVFTKEIIIIK